MTVTDNGQSELLLNELLEYYQGVPLRQHESYRGSHQAGFCVTIDGQRIGGASVGPFELEILYNIIRLSEARFTLAIGVAFGLSTLALAKAYSRNHIFAIDNFSEKDGYRPRYVQSIAEGVFSQFDNVELFVGTSPDDIPLCLTGLPPSEHLSVVFIDGEHTDIVAKADFYGALPYLMPDSIIAWHDIDKIPRAFRESFDEMVFDQAIQLPTWGHLGVFINSQLHPNVAEYLFRIGNRQ